MEIRKALTLLLILLLAIAVRSQDLFDRENSLKYATHLLNSGRYNLAATEYERIIFTYNPGDSVNHLLFKSYFLNKNYRQMLDRLEHLYLNPLAAGRIVARVYAYALTLAEEHIALRNFLSVNPGLSATEKKFFLINSYLLNNQWPEAKSTYKSLPDSNSFRPYSIIFNEIDNAAYKSYPAAIGLSAIVPGMGKVYTGDWKDGIISFVFVAGMSLQAYRGYKNYGTESGHFIGYASLAGVFYLSNLYGTYRSVKKHNESTRQKIQNRIRSTFISAY